MKEIKILLESFFYSLVSTYFIVTIWAYFSSTYIFDIKFSVYIFVFIFIFIFWFFYLGWKKNTSNNDIKIDNKRSVSKTVVFVSLIPVVLFIIWFLFANEDSLLKFIFLIYFVLGYLLFLSAFLIIRKILKK